MSANCEKFTGVPTELGKSCGATNIVVVAESHADPLPKYALFVSPFAATMKSGNPSPFTSASKPCVTASPGGFLENIGTWPVYELLATQPKPVEVVYVLKYTPTVWLPDSSSPFATSALPSPFMSTSRAPCSF